MRDEPLENSLDSLRFLLSANATPDLLRRDLLARDLSSKVIDTPTGDQAETKADIMLALQQWIPPFVLPHLPTETQAAEIGPGLNQGTRKAPKLSLPATQKGQSALIAIALGVSLALIRFLVPDDSQVSSFAILGITACVWAALVYFDERKFYRRCLVFLLGSAATLTTFNLTLKYADSDVVIAWDSLLGFSQIPTFVLVLCFLGADLYERSKKQVSESGDIFNLQDSSGTASSLVEDSQPY